MSIISKLFGLWIMNKTMSNSVPLFMRLLGCMAALMLCAVVAVAVIVMVLVGAVWLVYMQLTAYGMDAQSSALIIGALLLLLLLVILLAAKKQWRQLRSTAQRMVQFQPPVGGQVARTFDAFMDGFTADTPMQK
jgi:uncharacterized membrane protein